MNEFDLLENFNDIFNSYILQERVRYATMTKKELKRWGNHIEYPEGSPYLKILKHFNILDYKNMKDAVYEVLFQKLAEVDPSVLNENDEKDI
jgi:hypothetical protein